MNPLQELTDSQQKALAFLRSHIAAKGYPPSVRDISRKLGFTSPNAAHSILKQLEKKGYIHREKNISRGITVIPAPTNVAA